MLQLQLVRDFFTSYATLGYLTEPSGRKWTTIERPWIPASGTVGGLKGQSCVPTGEYKVQRYSSDAHPGTFILSAPHLDVYAADLEVPPHKRGVARTKCLIHPANWASELRGCIAPGKNRARDSESIWMVTRSRDAMNELRNAIGASIDIHLTITTLGDT